MERLMKYDSLRVQARELVQRVKELEASLDKAETGIDSLKHNLTVGTLTSTQVAMWPVYIIRRKSVHGVRQVQAGEKRSLECRIKDLEIANSGLRSSTARQLADKNSRLQVCKEGI